MRKTLVINALLISSVALYSGNKDRVGEAGATELKINPWAASSGLGGSNTASVIGVEAMNLNVSGLAFLNKTEMVFSSTNWLSGSDITINSLGFGQRLNESSVLGISVMAMSFGRIDITTVDQPEGGELGKFSPLFLNIGVSYSKAFSNSIYGGFTVRSINQQIANASARGVALDAGIRYVTGVKENIKFGISLRNIGPKMQYSGDGFSESVIFNDIEYTLEQRSQGYELPAILNIGATYDFHFRTKEDTVKLTKASHILSVSGNFLSNAFGNDQMMLGLEYSFKRFLKVRAGYSLEQGGKILNTENSRDFTNAFTGPSAGLSLNLPLNKNVSFMGIDYSYRPTVSFAGTHSIGIRIHL